MDANTTIAEYKRHLQALSYAKKTIELYGYCLNLFQQYLENADITDLRDVTRATMIDYQAEVVSQPLAPSTKSMKIRAVKNLFDHLQNQTRILINPTRGVPGIKEKERKMGRVLTCAEMQCLLEQPNMSLSIQARDRAIMEMLYSTGLRCDELLNLTIADVDLKDRVVFVQKGKGGNQRVVPVGKKAVLFLKNYLEGIRPRHARKNPKVKNLFLTLDGFPLTWNAIRDQVDFYRIKAGIRESIGMHTFRRSCATHMLQKGADIRYIQELLGHKKLKTTQRYTKIIPLDLKKTHEKTHPNVNPWETDAN